MGFAPSSPEHHEVQGTFNFMILSEKSQSQKDKCSVTAFVRGAQSGPNQPLSGFQGLQGRGVGSCFMGVVFHFCKMANNSVCPEVSSGPGRVLSGWGPALVRAKASTQCQVCLWLEPGPSPLCCLGICNCNEGRSFLGGMLGLGSW